MKALVFGTPPSPDEIRPEAHDEATRWLFTQPFGLHDLEDAPLRSPDWVITQPILAGICGSDSKLVLGDFSDGDVDNPLAAFASFPIVPGHEVVARVLETGPEAKGLDVGQRVVLNPWLSCVPRQVDPPCPACDAGDLSLCWSFTKGSMGPGVHVGVVHDAPGGWAQLMSAHDSMLVCVPDSVTDEAAVLADPFAVSLHAVLRHPPRSGARVLVYGAGALGATTVSALKALHPEVEIAVVARFSAQGDLARLLGASEVFAHEPRNELVENLARWSGGVLHQPIEGLPMTHPGGIDIVYDTIGKAETLEVGVRVLAERGTLVQTGVHGPSRWESTPVYFKELTIAGSNAFGVEELDGVRKHALAHYLDLVVDDRVDVTPMLTHRFPLERWWEAFDVLSHQDESGAVKVAFEPGVSAT